MILLFEQFLNESINDKIKMKVLFLCGIPNAGKSTALKSIADLPVSVIDPDTYVELLSKRDNIDLDFSNDKDIEKKHKNRLTSFKMVAHKMHNSVNSLLGVIVCGTGRNLKMMEDFRHLYETWGYDTAMLYVNTDLHVALERNRKRIRRFPPDSMVVAAGMIEQNLPIYRKIYGNNFFELSEEYPIQQVSKQLRTFFNASVQNERGKEILAEMQNRGLKYLTELDSTFASVNFGD